MKVAFVGKGGSGKTTVSALLARTLGFQGYPVLAIDADINQHLARTVGMDDKQAQAISPMGLEVSKIKDYLCGTNPRVTSAMMIKTTPPGEGSQLIRFGEQNPIFNHFVRDVSGVRVMAVGPFGEEDLGVKCYHSKTGSVELLLNHFIDAAKEYVIVDMTAGADSFASGLFTRFDVTFLVVEPTDKSLGVYEQYKHYAREHQVEIKVLGNKIESEDDVVFIREKVGDDLVACLGISAFVKKTDRGSFLVLSELENDNKRALADIISFIDSKEKNWKKFYDQAVEFHKKNATSWANVAMGEDLTKQIDPAFRLEKIV